MAKKRTTHGMVLRLAAVLLILVMLSGRLAVGRFARYTSTVTASDSARVAKFEVKETITLLTDDIIEPLIPGESVVRTIVVENKSEVTVKYSVSLINLTGNLPLAISLEKSGGGASASGTYDLLDVGETAAYNVRLYWPDELAEDRSAEYSGKIDIVRIVLTAEQVD